MGKTQHVVEDFNVEGGIPFATNYPNVEEVNSPDINLIT